MIEVYFCLLMALLFYIISLINSHKKHNISIKIILN